MVKFTSILLAALATAHSTSAQSLPACEPPSKAGILLPKRNATISSSKPVRVYHCSSAYFRSSTISIDVILSPNSTFSSGALLASGLKPNVAGSNNQYLYNITIPSTYGPRGKGYLGVFERIDGYYNDAYQAQSLLVNVV
ncbi:hypothetical protein V8E36_000950 [Tilletia maclaganii]